MRVVLRFHTHANTLNASMASLRTHMKHVGEADVIVWHEGDLTPEDADALDGAANVRFCLLRKETGWGRPLWLKTMPSSEFSDGYRFMIRFYAVTIWPTVPGFASNAPRRVVGQWGGAGGAICEDHLAFWGLFTAIYTCRRGTRFVAWLRLVYSLMCFLLDPITARRIVRPE